MIFKVMCFTLFVMCVQGCSSKFAYNNADWLSQWYIDDYLDLNVEQNRILEKELESTLEWHRDTQLSQYKQHLLALSADLNALPISENTWLGHFNAITGHWHRARKELSFRTAQLAHLLDQRQVDHLFKKLHENNQDKLQDFNEKTLQEYREEQYDKLLDTLEGYLGSINPQQAKYILEFTNGAAVTEQEWFDSKVDLQKSMAAVFENAKGNTFKEQLYLLMINPDQFKANRLLAAYETNRILLISMLYKLGASLSFEQVKYFKQEITDLVMLIEKLEKQSNRST